MFLPAPPYLYLLWFWALAWPLFLRVRDSSMTSRSSLICSESPTTPPKLTGPRLPLCALHVEDRRFHLRRKHPRGQVQRHPRTGLEALRTEPAAAPDHIPRSELDLTMNLSEPRCFRASPMICPALWKAARSCSVFAAVVVR